MRSTNKHAVSFGDVLCNTKTGKFYVIAGYALGNGNRRRVFMTCLEAMSSLEILHEPPISFDKEKIAEMAYVNNVEESLRTRIQEKGHKFDTHNINFARFRCWAK